ncbi:hypothetical protein PS6_010928 [Mucor atramentarius]
MPPASNQLAISKPFIKDSDQFKRITVGRSTVGNHEMYDVILDEVSAITMKLKQGCLKYLSPEASASTTEQIDESNDLLVFSEDLLDDAVQP